MKKTDGFTLVELMVGILCAALVSGAIATFMLMGLRTNRTVIDSNVEQQNARIIMTMVESLASEGSITRLKVDGILNSTTDDGSRSWTLYGENDSGEIKILSYDHQSNSILSHGSTVLMEGVTASMLSMSPSPMGGCLLGIAIQTDEAFYQTSVYNRSSRIEVTGEVVDENKHFHVTEPDSSDDEDTDPDSTTVEIDTSAARLAFIKILTSQIGSTGTIIGDKTSANIPYSLWYCFELGYERYPHDWDENTPWCATFISWAVSETEKVGYTPSDSVFFANVDKFWRGNDPSYHRFTGQKLNNDAAITAANNANNITPGDLIFFDWERNSWDAPQSLDHVGIVLFIDEVNGLVYTIEGNSGDQVALRRYNVKDPNIVGYGILTWNTNT